MTDSGIPLKRSVLLREAHSTTQTNNAVFVREEKAHTFLVQIFEAGLRQQQLMVRLELPLGGVKEAGRREE